MRIAIDGNEANVTERVGSNAYAYELLCALEKNTKTREDTVTVLLSAPKQKDLPAEREGWKYVIVKPAAFWTQIALPIHLFIHQKSYDVFYTPGHYGPRMSSVPYVSSVMDLGFLEYPRQFRTKDYLQLKEWTRYSVAHASRVIAISQFTKQDIVQRYHISPKKIIVAYPGFHRNPTQVVPNDHTHVLKKWHIHQPFILYVGTLQPRKNLVRLIHAFELLRRNASTQVSSPQQLVIAGKIGWLSDEIMQTIRRSPYKKDIICTGFVSDEEKIILYRSAMCTVLVGLYEGFGIPVLEAMAYGSLAVVSKSSSLPEVVDSAGILVEPMSVKDIARGITEVFAMPAKEHAKLLKKGREQVKKFSWERSADIVLHTLHEVGKHDR